jgi:hypothetical protein
MNIILQWKPLIAVGLGVEKWWQVLGSEDSVDWCVFTQPSIWLKLCKQDFESPSRVTETFSFLFLISVHNSVLQVVPRSRGFGAKWSANWISMDSEYRYLIPSRGHVPGPAIGTAEVPMAEEAPSKFLCRFQQDFTPWATMGHDGPWWAVMGRDGPWQLASWGTPYNMSQYMIQYVIIYNNRNNNINNSNNNNNIPPGYLT